MEKTRHEGNQPVCNELLYIIAKHLEKLPASLRDWMPLDAANYCSPSVDMTNHVHGSASQFDRRPFRSKVDRNQKSVRSKTRVSSIEARNYCLSVLNLLFIKSV